MAVLASLDEPGVLVSTVEIESPDKPYSFQTVEQLNALYGAGTNLFFIMGADSFEEINTWREPSRLLAGANVVVVTRPGYELQSSHLPADFISSIIDTRGRPADEAGARDVASPGPWARHVYLTDYVNNDVSSTEIRQRVRDGQAVEGLVSPRVAGYIEKYELYRR
jgi:nicotinate-nucleotide adenylyltransferase